MSRAATRMSRNTWGLDSPRDEWGAHRLCNPTNADWFDVTSVCDPPKLSVDNRAALRLCRRCPVRVECYAEWVELPASLRASHVAGAAVWDHHGQQVNA